MKDESIVLERQQPLFGKYLQDPKTAWITDIATVEGVNLEDPFRTIVTINEEIQQPFKVGVHRALGGLHDAPNPGDILCAALAACFESTLRMVANRLHITLKKTKVEVKAHVDVRGTLMLDTEVPVGFQRMEIDLELLVDENTKERMIHTLVKATKHCCVVYQTVSKGTPIEVRTEILNLKSKPIQ